MTKSNRKLIMKSIMKYFALIILVFLFIECSSQDDEKTSAVNNENLEEAGSSLSAVEKIQIEEVKDIIRNRNGKPLFLNIWATWCPPCREEIPAINEVSNKYGDKVDFIGLSVDAADDFEVVKSYTKQNIEYKIYHADLNSDEELIEFLSKDWNGAIPLTIMYDENGNRKEFILGSRDYDFFNEKLEALVN